MAVEEQHRKNKSDSDLRLHAGWCQRQACSRLNPNSYWCSVGFLGNALIFFFLWKKKSRPRSLIESNPFTKNMKAYVRRLSLSDLLCCAVSLPLVCIQFFFDIFQISWPCDISTSYFP